jgi:hypothetical protein
MASQTALINEKAACEQAMRLPHGGFGESADCAGAAFAPC